MYDKQGNIEQIINNQFITPMAKAAVGTKKSKDQISKAANQKKGGAKKWTKGRTKEKSEHAVFLDRASYDRILTGIPKLGKHISVSSVVEKFKISGSLARVILRTLEQTGVIKATEKHSRQTLYYPAVTAVEKTAVATEKDAGKKGKKK